MSQPFERGRATLNRTPLDNPRLLSGAYWGELRIFLAVAKSKSFNRAAEELKLSQPTVSRQVRRLQDLMGSQLILSSTSGIALTDRGKELADALLLLDERLFSLSNQLRAETKDASGRVRVTSTEALGGIFIVPNLQDFSALYPNIQIYLKNPLNLLSFRENQSDIMLGFGPSSERGIESRSVGMVHLIPVATGSYLSRYGVPTRANLEHHHFVDAEYYSSQTETWSSWHNALKRGTVAHLCDNSFAYAFMVKEGLGIGLVGNYALCDSQLVLLNLGIHVKLPLYLLAATERLNCRPVRLVYDWLTEILTLRNAWFSPEFNLDTYPRKALSATLGQFYSDTPFAVEAD